MSHQQFDEAISAGRKAVEDLDADLLVIGEMGIGNTTIAAAVTAALLGGCASFSTDGGFGSVQSAAKDRLGKQVQWSRTAADADSIERRVGELLAKPLTADDAVQLALLNNRGLQATYQELGIAEAELVHAEMPEQPAASSQVLH